MSKLCLTTAVFFSLFISARAEDAPFSSGSICGLGTRNIGSAAVSGRISAIAGTKEPSGGITLFFREATGGVWKLCDGGTRFRAAVGQMNAQSAFADATATNDTKEMLAGSGET